MAGGLFTDADRPFKLKELFEQKLSDYEQWDLYKQALRDQVIQVNLLPTNNHHT